jgi:hypothetical protein
MVGHGFRTLFALGAIAAALFVFGCGSSDDEGETTQASSAGGGTPLSEAEYQKRAEAICRKTGEEQAKQAKQIVAENSSDAGGGEQISELTIQAAKPLFENMIGELEDLEPPAGSKGELYREWVESVGEAVDKMEADPDKAVEATVTSHHKAKRIGLKTCSLL